MAGLNFRVATIDDADAVASLHARSWRRHYRGAYSDEFLDGDVIADRLKVWSERLSGSAQITLTVIAESESAPVGFVHVVLDADPVWGALIDNLHVDVASQRSGIGAALMVQSARFVVEEQPSSGLYLWVLEQNTSAQAFYAAIGGEPVEAGPVPSVGGVPGRLNGTPVRLRYVWRKPADLALTGRVT